MGVNRPKISKQNVNTGLEQKSRLAQPGGQTEIFAVGVDRIKSWSFERSQISGISASIFVGKHQEFVPAHLFFAC
jgi:hypothetical protein